MSAPCLPVHHPKKRKRNGNIAQGRKGEGDENDDHSQKTTFEDVHLMDATEYLSRVVNQAKSMPDVFTAKNASAPKLDGGSTGPPPRLRDYVPIDGSAASLSYLVSGRASLTPPPNQHFLPRNKAWIDTTIEGFVELRSYLEETRLKGIGGKKTDRTPLPPMKDRSGWHIFCVGEEEARGNTGSYFGDDNDNTTSKAQQNTRVSEGEEASKPPWQSAVPSEGYTPGVRLLNQMDQVLVRRVLSHLQHYTSLGWPMTPKRAAWIYALLARLEKPVHREDAAILFGLLKTLTASRAKLSDVQTDDRKALAQLNLLIVIIGIFFEQGASKVMSVSEYQT